MFLEIKNFLFVESLEMDSLGIGKVSLSIPVLKSNNECNSSSWKGYDHNFEVILETGYVDHAYVNH